MKTKAIVTHITQPMACACGGRIPWHMLSSDPWVCSCLRSYVLHSATPMTARCAEPILVAHSAAALAVAF